MRVIEGERPYTAHEYLRLKAFERVKDEHRAQGLAMIAMAIMMVVVACIKIS